MQKKNFFISEKLKNTESAQLYSYSYFHFGQ